MMKFFCTLLAFLVSVALAIGPLGASTSTFLSPRIDDGLTQQVSWDGFSFSIRTSQQNVPRRIFLQSGEMHPWRLPVPDLWRDICQKAKAAGLNAISFYTHWGMMNPKNGVLDLEGINNIQPLFDAAKEAGLWVIARPGPYINSETSGGGIPGWVTTLPGDPSWSPYNGELRSNDTHFHNAWQDYIKAMAMLIAKNQITQGGPVIMVQVENEYYNGAGQNDYVLELQAAYRANGVVVPTMVNDPGLYQNLVNDSNIYGVDAYPDGWTCTGSSTWRDIPTTWRAYHEQVMPQTPFFFPEFQGGQYDKWASGVGYDKCRDVIGAQYERVFYHQLWAQGVTANNFYMFYGGTNWGQIPFPATYTSYDVGASVKENRELTPKYSELKLQSLFLRSTPDLYKTSLVGRYSSSGLLNRRAHEYWCFHTANSTTMTDNQNVYTTWLKNTDTGANFFIIRQVNVSSDDIQQYKLHAGDITIPNIAGSLVLSGRDSRLVTYNLAFGDHSKLLYSTSHIMTSLTIDGADVLVVYADLGEMVELSLAVPSLVAVDATFDVKPTITKGSVTFNFNVTQGISTLNLVGSQPIKVIVADYVTATTFWQPTIAGKGAFGAFADVAAATPILVAGPYLVRTASLQGQNLALTGDVNATTTLLVFAPSSVRNIVWNGKLVKTSKTSTGALQATLPGPNVAVATVLDLKALKWKYADSLPEIQNGYDDSKWVKADHINTTSKFPRYYGGPWNLSVASDYGYHVGNLLWRGHFNNAGQKAVNLSISGGSNFAASAWVNNVFLGSTDNLTATNNVSWAFPDGALKASDNVVTVLQDHMGFNLAGEIALVGQIVCCTPGGRQRDIQSPRGIEGYYLLGANANPNVTQFRGWKVQGNFGGESYPDRTRKIFNEGGLYGERVGFHLPGFDDSRWESMAPWQGVKAPGVAWFRTTFKLSIPEGNDVPMSFVFSDEPGHYRAQLYVNGWQMCKRIANLGPQTSFPVHEGILNYRGTNTLAISLWSLGDAPADKVIPSLELVPSAVYVGGPGLIKSDNPGWYNRRAW